MLAQVNQFVGVTQLGPKHIESIFNQLDRPLLQNSLSEYLEGETEQMISIDFLRHLFVLLCKHESHEA